MLMGAFSRTRPTMLDDSEQERDGKKDAKAKAGERDGHAAAERGERSSLSRLPTPQTSRTGGPKGPEAG